ncbi:penicillin acylase family protein [Burkholderia oklahomensis]|uniref:penicillin acylase family protein n=1 Tax=Burkholderia oklahomensis TaxID=342113 RepID=UPI0002E022CB|nr:penicillin acylase family protein [Burkholderia oklahomensis]SUW55664.1 Penicillin G acylase precursor [Burkholderia oklahomensis]
MARSPKPLTGFACRRIATASEYPRPRPLISDVEVRGLFGLTKARDWPGFRRALADIQSLSLNFMFASRSVDTGVKTVGRVPRRRTGLKHTLAPNDWDSFLEFDALPELLNPPSGVIVNCNNPIADARDDVPPALLWNPSFRAWRVDTLLKAKSTWTVGDMEAVLGDTTHFHARQRLPMLLPLLDAHAGEHVALLRQWDCRDERASPAALV